APHRPPHHRGPHGRIRPRAQHRRVLRPHRRGGRRHPGRRPGGGRGRRRRL
ncbi:MAG: hypothetical protein AVDCRST_MAG66-1134, partial [uncultured Pseudonocardia sp.]